MSEFKPLEPRNLGHFTDVEVKNKFMWRQGSECRLLVHDLLGRAVVVAHTEEQARLIAAAPDLLSALYNMLEDGDKTDRQQAMNAIKKATGETP